MKLAAFFTGFLATTLVLTAQGSQAEVRHAGPTMAQATAAQGMRPVEAASGDPVSSAPYLRAVLPEQALAYLRLPNVWGLLGTPKGNLFDQAIGSAVHVETVKAIRAGFARTLLPTFSRETLSLWPFLLVHMRSPVELVALPPADSSVPMVELLVTAEVDFASSAELNAWLRESDAALPAVQLVSEVNLQGMGVLRVGPYMLPVYFDEDSRRVFVLVGLAVTPDSLKQRVSALSPGTDHPMLHFERALDTSGQGLFGWLNPGRALEQLEASGGAEQAAMVKAFGGSEVSALAFGVGTTRGKHRVTLLVEMPPVGFRSLIPTVHSDVHLEVVGTPQSMLMMRLPSPEDLLLMENTLMGILPPEAIQGYQDMKANLRQTLGFGLEDILAVFGQEVIMVFDQAGEYGAMRIRDRGRFEAMWQRLAEQTDLVHEQREIAGRTYHHLAVSAFPYVQATVSEAGDEIANRVLKHLLGLPSHLYWTEEGEYVLVAGVPQILLDRAFIDHRMPVEAWLEEQQRVDPSGALLLATTRTPAIPRLMYQVNLWILLTLGDLVGRPVDLFRFPSPRELGLPREGAYSFQINSTESVLSLELSFDGNPAEILFTGGGVGAFVAAELLRSLAAPPHAD